MPGDWGALEEPAIGADPPNYHDWGGFSESEPPDVNPPLSAYGRLFLTLEDAAAALELLGITNQNIPSLTGHSGQFLTNDGVGMSWANVSGTGDVVGPSSSVNNHVAVFSGTTGKLLIDAGFAPASDSNVVHKTGTETIGGEKQFTVSGSTNPSNIFLQGSVGTRGGVGVQTDAFDVAHTAVGLLSNNRAVLGGFDRDNASYTGSSWIIESNYDTGGGVRQNELYWQNDGAYRVLNARWQPVAAKAEVGVAGSFYVDGDVSGSKPFYAQSSLFYVKGETGSSNTLMRLDDSTTTPQFRVFANGVTSVTGHLAVNYSGGLTDRLHINDSSVSTDTNLGGNPSGITFQNTNNTAGNYTSLWNLNSAGNLNAALYFKNIDQSYAGAIDLVTRKDGSTYQIAARFDKDGNTNLYKDVIVSGKGTILTASPSANVAGLQIGAHLGVHTVPACDIYIGGHSGNTSRVRRIATGSYDNDSDFGCYLDTNYTAPHAIAIFGTRDGGTDVDAFTITNGVTALAVATATSLSFTGTGGAGYLELTTQSSAPSAPAANDVRLYANSGLFSWIKSDGFRRSFSSALTANRTYTLPDKSGTVAMTSDLVSAIQLTTPNVLFASPVDFGVTGTAWSGSLTFNTHAAWTFFGNFTGSTATPAFVAGTGTGTPVLGTSPTFTTDFGFSTSRFVGGTNTVDMRNSTNAQALHVYGTYTDASNYKRISIKGNAFSTGAPGIELDGLGTGANPSFYFGTTGTGNLNFVTNNNSVRWGIDGGDGAFYPGADSTYDIGYSSDRVRNIYLSGLLYLGSTIDVGIARNAAGILEINNTTTGQWGALKCGVRDSGTATVTDAITIGHQSSGTPAAGLGTAIMLNLNSTTTADRNAARIAALWTIATDASRAADLVFYARGNGNMNEVGRFAGLSGALYTGDIVSSGAISAVSFTGDGALLTNVYHSGDNALFGTVSADSYTGSGAALTFPFADGSIPTTFAGVFAASSITDDYTNVAIGPTGTVTIGKSSSAQVITDDGGKVVSISADNWISLSGDLLMNRGLAAWGVAAVSGQPTAPTTLGEAIAVLQTYGLCAT